MTMNGSSHSTLNGQHSSKAVNSIAETEEMKQAAFVKAAQSTGALLLYLLSSSYIIILNKQLMVDDGFKFPLALTGLSQVAGALAGAYALSSLVSFKFPSLSSTLHSTLCLTDHTRTLCPDRTWPFMIWQSRSTKACRWKNTVHRLIPTMLR